MCVSVTLTVTADNECNVYADGDEVLASYTWDEAHSVSLDEACVLAIFAINGDGGDAGILASTSTGVVTDASWKCSTTDPTGWRLPGFDDAAWAQAQVIAANDGSVRASVAEISSDAKWIWTQNTNDVLVFCRKTLC